MTVNPGDVIDGRWEIGKCVAIQGLEGCESPECTRAHGGPHDGACMGYHCPDCLESVSMCGHRCPVRGE